MECPYIPYANIIDEYMSEFRVYLQCCAYLAVWKMYSNLLLDIVGWLFTGKP
jgi:hypothetical protein